MTNSELTLQSRGVTAHSDADDSRIACRHPRLRLLVNQCSIWRTSIFVAAASITFSGCVGYGSW